MAINSTMQKFEFEKESLTLVRNTVEDNEL